MASLAGRTELTAVLIIERVTFLLGLTLYIVLKTICSNIQLMNEFIISTDLFDMLASG
jgi:hypothetical protein